MDKFDRILSKYSNNDLPDGLTDRIRLNFRRKYHFRQKMLVLSAFLLIIAGFCVVFPEAVAANQQLAFPPVDASSNPAIALPLTISQNSPTGLWDGITEIQDTILTTFSLPAWLGLFSVGVGSVIGIGGLFPRLRTR